MSAMRTTAVDAAIDLLDEDESPATVIADLLDKAGAWDWTDESDHDPSDRVAVVESSGAWWAVYRGVESDEARRCATRSEAVQITENWIASIEEA